MASTGAGGAARSYPFYSAYQRFNSNQKRRSSCQSFFRTLLGQEWHRISNGSDEVPSEPAVSPGDTSGRCFGKVTAEVGDVLSASVLQHPASRCAGILRELTKHRHEVGFVDLQRMMKDVASEQSLGTLRAQGNRGVIDAMPGRQMKRDAIEELGSVYLDELGQAGFHNRHDAIRIDARHGRADRSSHTCF